MGLHWSSNANDYEVDEKRKLFNQSIFAIVVNIIFNLLHGISISLFLLLAATSYKTTALAIKWVDWLLSLVLVALAIYFFIKAKPYFRTRMLFGFSVFFTSLSCLQIFSFAIFGSIMESREALNSLNGYLSTIPLFSFLQMMVFTLSVPLLASQVRESFVLRKSMQFKA